jgi:hypothetical protein
MGSAILDGLNSSVAKSDVIVLGDFCHGGSAKFALA